MGSNKLRSFGWMASYCAAVLLIIVLTFTVARPAGKSGRGPKKTKSRPAPTAPKGANRGPKKSSEHINPNVSRRQEVYKSVGRTELNIHIFEPAQKLAGARYPAIVFFHGGGFTTGSPIDFFRHCEYFAGRGMIAMSAGYRLMGRTPGTTPVECDKDGKSAIRWVRANAARLGIDPTRIAAGGGSAGGHIAAATAMLPGLDEPGEDTRVSCRPDALVLFNPALGSLNPDPDAKVPPELRPIVNIRPGTPPAIIMFGTEDWAISVADGQYIQKKMQATGSRCELRIYPGQRHGFFNYDSQPDHKYYFITLADADRFLASLGWIQGEPTLRRNPQ